MALVGNLIIAAELAFQNSIYTTGALLGTQLAQIVRLAARAVSTATTAARTSMLTRSEVATFDRTFRSETAFAFKIKFFAFAPAEFTNRTKILRHVTFLCSSLHAALLRRTTAVVRNRSNIRN